jgi:hypothetical protein
LVEAYELFKAIEARQREPQVVLERPLQRFRRLLIDLVHA